MNKRGKVWKLVSLAVLIVFVAGIAIYYSFFYMPSCGDSVCFQNALTKCSHAQYVSEQSEASWGYTIQGTSGNLCQVDVKLLQAKKGSLGIDALNGLSMTCSVSLGVFGYPEKDLTQCTGILKEKLLEIQINKLHTYIINNLGKFDESLNAGV